MTDENRATGDAPEDVEEGPIAPDEVKGGGKDEGKEGAPDETAASAEGVEAQQEVETRAEARLIIVGLGASAGGLEPLGEVIRDAPPDGMAYVVVQHLAPHHESALTQLLARTSRLEVVTAADGMLLEPSHVYVIPPNADLAVLHGVIHLVTPPGGHGARLPIDYLFRSLADDQGSSAIGVVLSGTGSDGTFGLKAIKAAGGLTFAQDPSTAKYDGMPRSAIASGAADFVLAPRDIGEELARISQRSEHRPIPRATELPQGQDQLGKLFVLIRSEFGTDLMHYKQSTIERRIERRMTMHRLDRLDDYVELVLGSPDELRALYDDMLITVTSFFRDPEVFDALKATVFPQIFERKEGSRPVRVWVPACATGEEAYSIAMCMLEFCEEHICDARIQMFGTDLNEDAIQHARRGIYPANVTLDVSPERLNRFFVRKDSELHIARRIRDMIVFSRQDVLKDAPFSRMDLVSCRNLLIYLQPAAQKKVLRLLHYALNPNGYLLLGASETVGDAPGLFSALDRKHKLYRKKLVSVHALDVGLGVSLPAEPPQPAATARPPMSLQALVDRKVLDLYGPAGVVINEDLEIMQFRGHTGPYLDPMPGTASLNLLKIARFELHLELKRAVQQAVASRERVTTHAMYPDGDRQRAVELDAVPLQDPDTQTRCLLVTFRPMPPPREIPMHAAGDAQTSEAVLPLAQRIQELERELAAMREYLQTTMEERESTLEELKSANEELQSSNEELQSTNEELETSKEEMESTNEELTTVNDELQSRMAELSQINDDLHNVLAGVDNAVVIVGLDLKIRRYTVAAARLFNLVPGDIGRSIGFLDPFFATAAAGDGALEPKLSAVIQSLSSVEEEVQASNHRWYALRIIPYKTLDHAIRGALLTLVDIDVRKRATEITRDVGAYADRFLAPIGHPLLIVDRKLRVVWCNDPFLATFQLAREETIGSTLPSLGARQFAEPALRDRLEPLLAAGTTFRNQRLRYRSRETGEHTFCVSGSQVPASGETPLVLLSIEPLPPPPPDQEST